MIVAYRIICRTIKRTQYPEKAVYFCYEFSRRKVMNNNVTSGLSAFRRADVSWDVRVPYAPSKSDDQYNLGVNQTPIICGNGQKAQCLVRQTTSLVQNVWSSTLVLESPNEQTLKNMSCSRKIIKPLLRIRVRLQDSGVSHMECLSMLLFLCPVETCWTN